MSLRKRSKLRSIAVFAAIVLCATAVSCSRGRKKSDGGSKAGGSNPLLSWRSEGLIDGTGIGALRIDEATVEKTLSALGLPADHVRIFDDGTQEMRSPFFRISFIPPAGGGVPKLYAVWANLRDDVYKGKTSKGIGFLDTLEAVHAAYGQPEAVWVTTNDRIHYYPQQGVIITTRHPNDIRPRELYGKARAALGKEPVDGPVVTAMMVVRPFNVLQGAETTMARQQVVSTRPKTDLLVSEF